VEVGVGIERALGELGLERRDLFVVSKLWNTYHRKEHVRLACEKSIRDLGVSYLDLYLIHFPIALRFVPIEKRYPPEWIHDPDAQDPRMELDYVSVRETWEAMEELQRDGLVKDIGVANFNVSLLMELMSFAKVPPAMNQVEMHPYLTQDKLAKFCSTQGIAMAAFSPLGAGSYIELKMAQETENVMMDPVVQKIAAKYSKTPAQVVLAWGLRRGYAVICKSVRLEKMSENLAASEIDLTDDDMREISSLNRNRRFNDPGEFCVGMGAVCPIYD